MAAAPALAGDVFLVVRIGHDPHEALVTADAAHILRRSGARTGDAGAGRGSNVEPEQDWAQSTAPPKPITGRSRLDSTQRGMAERRSRR